MPKASLFFAFVFLLFMFTTVGSAHGTCAAPANNIEQENCQPGTPQSVWDISGAGDPSIQGFATDISYNLGSTVNFKINTPASVYTITIYRMGYYQGNGARQIATVAPSATLPQSQPQCLTDTTAGLNGSGLYDCGNWAISASWTIPSTAVSGIYFAKLTRDTGGSSHVFFLVRDDSSHSDLLFQTSDETWQAFNDYGLGSLYGPNNATIAPNSRSFKASYNRPFHTRAVNNGVSFIFNSEYPMVRFLEANGYDVSYAAGLDSDRNGSLIKNHKAFLSVGHDAFWSASQRNNVQAALAAGTNLAFFSGSESFWKSRYENSIDGSNTSYRTLVSYRETLANAVIDPQDPPTSTGSWRDPRYSTADGGKPENALSGTLFAVNGPENPPLSIQVPASDGKMRFWRNTNVATQTTGQTVMLPAGSLGFQWDIDADNGFRPAGLFDLSSATYNITGDLLLDYGATFGSGSATEHMTMYRAPSGALVFSAGTIQWSWGLDATHDAPIYAGFPADPRMQQATVNLLADMGAQPVTLAAGLIPASPSTDTVAPTSTITSPPSGSTLPGGEMVTVMGTATDSSGVVGGVEVSVDGGVTWHPATGHENWSYNWTVPSSGSATIVTRAVDDSGNLEIPADDISVTAGAPGASSTFPATVTPGSVDGGDPTAGEYGVKFRSDINGFITGIRFYKSTANTGTHLGHLWTSTGTLLASATFSGETASGWQTVSFSTPVAITANTTYIASYFAPNGHYSFNAGYFSTSGVDNAPLHLLAAGVDGPNGVYAYNSTSTFPTSSYNSSNYWVDVTFSGGNIPPAVVAVSPTNGAIGIDRATGIAATFNEPIDPTTVTASTFQLLDPSNTLVSGTVSYNSSTRTATLQPNAVLATASTYTAVLHGGVANPRIKDTFGNTLPTNVSWSFTTAVATTPPGNCPCTIWSPAATPTKIDSGDVRGVDVGVTFKSDADGFITGIRFYKATTNTGTHVGSLWTANGTLLASATFTGETASGWQQVSFNVPVAITSDTVYVASYFAPAGHYSADQNYFASAGVDNFPLHALANGVVGGNGLYTYAATSSFPNSSYNASNYWVDVVYVGSGTTASPQVVSTLPGSGATGANLSGPITVTFNEPMDATTMTASNFVLLDPSNNSVPGSVSYSAANYTMSFQPSSGLQALSNYRATVSGTVRDSSGHTMGSDYNWSFITGSANTLPPGSCPCDIWSSTATPTKTDADDPQGVEVGVKFRADANGYITGIRFYKSSLNQGTHIGNLWTSTGTLLGSATFTGETASGWQEATFSSPVAITASTTYIASYFDPNGHYAADQNYFASAGVDNGPLHALSNAIAGGNGVYAYSSTSTFPNQTFSSTNYWVDVEYLASNSTTPPSIISSTPANGAKGSSLAGTITATFSESMNSSSINSSSFVLVDSSNNPVAGTVTYNSSTASLIFQSNASLVPLTTYSATVEGTVTDFLGNAMGSSYTWSFTTAAAPPNTGPGGPILVISSSTNPFTRYYSEILLAEGLNEFTVQDISTVTQFTLTAYDIVILGDMQLTSAQASMLDSWVAGGGNLIAMHPDKQLAGMLGLTSTTGTLTNAYLLINNSSGPGAGIVGQTIQFHGSADLYTLNGATSIATLFADASTTTQYPAVTWTGSGAGHAAAFTYDLARSVVYSRQGNPAWSGEQRDVFFDPTCVDCGLQIRSDDLFYGNASFDPEPDWIDFNKVAIPQADEQQRLLVNLIETMNAAKKPLPKFWYFPRGLKAVVIMTGDDHGNNGTTGRFDQYVADSAAGCSVPDWTCIRSTSYVFPITPLPNYANYVAEGFEIANHSNNDPSCTNFTSASLDAAITVQLQQFQAAYPGLPLPQTNRTHCVLWSDYDTEPQVLLNHGIRFDTSYYYWPEPWIQDRPGMFTGSGMPMRLSDRNGNTFDVYEATTQMPDESQESFPYFVDTLLDNAQGALGYYGAFVANMHTDMTDSPGSDSIVASAQAHNVPVISSLQMLTWLDGRNSSSFSAMSWNGSALSFTVTAAAGSRNLQVMIPVNSTAGALNGITQVGNPIAYTTQVVKGITYAMFTSGSGAYRATYGAGGPYSISGTVSGAGGNSATVTLSGAVSLTATADVSGNFLVTGLPNGTYTVKPNQPGYTFSPASQSVTVNNGNVTGINFQATLIPTYTVSGTISGAGGSAATVFLKGSNTLSTIADASGNFTFSGVINGNYTVTAGKSGYVFSPASQSVVVNSANVMGVNFSTTLVTSASLVIDASTSFDVTGSRPLITTNPFSTTYGNELLLAFVVGDNPGSGTNTTVTSVTGGGLTWVLVNRTNVQWGTAEIWRAFSASPLVNTTVTANFSISAPASSITVVSFTGADMSGTNGSGAIGATGSANAGPKVGTPTASLVTTRNNSWVFGVGNDWDQAIARTPGANQSLLHQYLSPNDDTYWVQMQNAPTPLSGSTVTINDTAPSSDRYNLSIVEVKPIGH